MLSEKKVLPLQQNEKGMPNEITLWTIAIVAVWGVCVLMAGVLIPQILLIAFRRNLFDEVNDRKIHRGAVPRLGGIAFKPVAFMAIAFIAGLDLLFGDRTIIAAFAQDACGWVFAFCAIMMLYLIGMADDLIGIRYRAKFVVQIVCGVLLISGGLWLNDFAGLLGIHEVPAYVGWPVTILFIVFLINAINLIDGIDGLCSGLCGVTLVFYGVTFFTLGQYAYALFSFAFFGVLVPFFYFNVFGSVEKRKKVFMGDTGSLTIGLVICFLSLKFSDVAPKTEGWPNPIALAFSPLIIPCFDVVRVYLHRVRRGNNPFLPDKTHIHHKLLALGFPQTKVMVLIIACAAVFTFINIIASIYIDITLLLAIDVALWIWANTLLTRRIHRRNIPW